MTFHGDTRYVSDLLVHAQRELAKAKATSDPVEAILARRQAAEKAWGYVCEQTNEVTRIDVVGAETHFQRKRVLAEIDRAAGTVFLRDYEEFQNRLHGDVFYDGKWKNVDLDDYLRRVAEYPERLRAAIRRMGAS